MIHLVKCYYCGSYYDEEEAIGWDICASCAIQEEKEYAWMDEEREDLVLDDLENYDLPHISVQRALEGEEE